MELMDEVTLANVIIIPAILLSLDLIISGIIGLKDKAIRANSLFMRIMFFPLGVLGRIFSVFYDSTDDGEYGKAALVASVSAIAAGIMVLGFFGFYYLSVHGLVSSEVLGVAVPAVLVFLLVAVPVASVIMVSSYEKQDKQTGKK